MVFARRILHDVSCRCYILFVLACHEGHRLRLGSDPIAVVLGASGPPAVIAEEAAAIATATGDDDGLNAVIHGRPRVVRGQCDTQRWADQSIAAHPAKLPSYRGYYPDCWPLRSHRTGYLQSAVDFVSMGLSDPTWPIGSGGARLQDVNALQVNGFFFFSLGL